MMMRELIPTVTDLELSRLLEKAKVPHYGALYWWDVGKNIIHQWQLVYLPWLEIDAADLVLVPAYTAQDLIAALPEDDIWFKKHGNYTTIKTKNDTLIMMNDTNIASFLGRVILKLKNNTKSS